MSRFKRRKHGCSAFTSGKWTGTTSIVTVRAHHAFSFGVMQAEQKLILLLKLQGCLKLDVFVLAASLVLALFLLMHTSTDHGIRQAARKWQLHSGDTGRQVFAQTGSI